jgi:predicted TIM-barrel fold metal-dependent hydrolase
VTAATDAVREPEQKEERASDRRRLTAIADCDVHENLVSPAQLLPYLAEPYKSWVGNGGFNPPVFSYVIPFSVTRGDARPDVGPAGSSLELLREQLLDRYGVRWALMNGHFHPTAFQCQPAAASALASAYNDWLREEWLDKDERLYGSIAINGRDPVAAVREIDRVATDPRFRQVMLSVVGVRWSEPQYDPIFEAAQRNGLQIGMHLYGIAASPALGNPDYFVDMHSVENQGYIGLFASLILNGTLEKFPDLGVALLEGGFAWIPSMLWRMDRYWKELRAEQPLLKRRPSEYVDRFLFTTQPLEFDAAARFTEILDQIGTDEIIAYSSDYPHFDFDAPNRVIPALAPELRQKVMVDNALRFYGLPAVPR